MSSPSIAAPTVPNAPLAQPRAEVAPYVSPFRTSLIRGRWVALAVTFLWALSCFFALRSADVATRVIGHDTTPSITAAERIHSLLADANGNLANMLLTDDAEDGPFSKAFRQDIRDAETSLVEAAENITYGDAEKIPITTIMRNVADYMRLVGMARSLGGDKRSIPIALSAETLMHGSILPATEALDKANDDQLTAAYNDHLSAKGRLTLLVWVMSLLSLAVLGALQFECYRRTRRLINIGLLPASLVVLLVSIYSLAKLAAAENQIYIAKTEAFDSIYALSNLGAVANDANASESFWLLAYDDPAARQKYADMFRVLTRKIVGVDVNQAVSDASANRQFPGFLGDELANITFVGEERAAKDTLAAWAAYYTIDGKIRALEAAGQKADALALDVGRSQGQSNWAFDRFSAALEKTLKINQAAFDVAIAQSESQINGVVYGVIAIGWLLAAFGLWFGVQLRVREYEF